MSFFPLSFPLEIELPPRSILRGDLNSGPETQISCKPRSSCMKPIV